MVAFEDVGAFDPQLACFAYWELALVWGHVFGGLVWEHRAHGSDGFVPEMPRLGVLAGWLEGERDAYLGVCGGRCFAESVALLDWHFESVMYGRDKLSC